MKRTIAIVCGGDTSEFQVSLRSAQGIYSFIDKEKYTLYIVEMHGLDWHVQLPDGGALLNITSLAVALIVGIVTNLIVNNGKLSSGEDGLSSAASEMGKVDPETTEIPSRKSKKK